MCRIPGRETLRGSPASSVWSGLRWAARRERVPGHAGAGERSAAGNAPWTPRRVAAKRMTAWTRAQRPEGERRGPGSGRGPLSELRGGSSRPGTFLDPAPESLRRDAAAGTVSPAGSPGETGGAVASPLSAGPALRAERRGPWLPRSGRAPPWRAEKWKDSRFRVTPRSPHHPRPSCPPSSLS